jgi:hypothetical protein
MMKKKKELIMSYIAHESLVVTGAVSGFGDEGRGDIAHKHAHFFQNYEKILGIKRTERVLFDGGQ